MRKEFAKQYSPDASRDGRKMNRAEIDRMVGEIWKQEMVKEALRESVIIEDEEESKRSVPSCI